jgi:DNA polymerase V
MTQTSSPAPTSWPSSSWLPLPAGAWPLAATRLRLLRISACVPAGFPSPAADHEESPFDLGELMLPNPAACFMMQARGESMIGHGILDGAWLIVDRSLRPTDGKIVVASINGDFTVKQFRRRGRRVRLEGGNPAYPDIEVGEDAELVIFGCVTWILNRA